jgi:hypothetical protein
MESYLVSLSGNARIKLSKFRCRNIKIPIEVGAYCDIPRQERKCKLCTANVLGDEFHYLFTCGHFHRERNEFIKKKSLYKNITGKTHQPLKCVNC